MQKVKLIEISWKNQKTTFSSKNYLFLIHDVDSPT